MNKLPDLTLSKDQGLLVDGIKAHYQGAKAAYDHQAQHIVLCGLKMMALRETAAHGNKADAEGFLKLREAFFPEISKSAAYRVMDFSKACLEKLPTLGNIRPAALQLTNGDLPEKEKEIVLKAVFQAADGKSWTALHRDLNLIRGKEHQKHTPPKPLTPDEELLAQREQADAVIDQAIGHLRHIIATEAMFDEHLSKGKAKELLMECRAYGSFFGKKKKAKGTK